MILGLLLVVLGLPSALSYFDLASSTSAGTAIAAGLATSLCYLRAPPYDIKLHGRISFGILAVLVLLGIALQGVLAAQFGQFEVVRGLGSMVLLGLLIWGGDALARLMASAGPSRVDKAARALFWILAAAALTSIANPFPSLSRSEKSVFPFTEPSFFALAFVPPLLYMCVICRRARVVLWVLGLAIAIMLESLTLLVGCAIVAAICLRPRVLLPILLSLALLAADAQLGYYTERLDFSEETDNRSTLVYLQGWQLVIDAWKRTSGLGVGLQQLGVEVTDDIPARDLLQVVAGEDVNMLDGGFVAAKLLAEFGVAGAVCIALYLWTAFRAVLLLRAAVRTPGQYNRVVIVAACCIVSFLVDLFVRGSGYFTATALLTTASLYIFLGKVFRRPTRPQNSRRLTQRTTPPTRFEAPAAS